VHPAESPGGEDADTGRGGQEGRAGDRGGPAEPERGGHRQVPDAELGQVGVGADPVDLLGGEPHVRHAVEDGDRRGHRTALADGGLHVVGRGAVVRARQAVREQRALQGDDRPAGTQRVGHLRGQDGSGWWTGSRGGGGMHPVIMEGTPSPPSREYTP
jgi:hypothetical protein